MTFRTADFRNSETLRSLQRLALEKGLIKPELKKEASAQPVSQPSEHFSENLVAFCEQLRSGGFEKYANEIEVKYLLMKQAETARFYDVTGEKGEDLVEFAHPEGGKKLDKDWSELGEVETIIEKQKKIQDAILKTPTGKLDPKTAATLIRVKIADASEDTVENALAQITDLMAKVDTVVSDRGQLMLRYPEYKYFKVIVDELLTQRPFTLDNRDALGTHLGLIYKTLEPGPTGGITADAWALVKPLLQRMGKPLKDIKAARTQELAGESAQLGGASTPTPSALSDTEARIATLIGKLTDLKLRPSTATNKRLTAWIDEEMKELNSFAQKVRTDPKPDDVADLKKHEDAVNSVMKMV